MSQIYLTRTEGQRLTIGRDVAVTLVQSHRGKAMLGIEAPRCIPIVRDEAVRRNARWPVKPTTALTYLASPYSHPDPAMRGARFMLACRASAWLLTQGILTFSPIAHSHPIAELGKMAGDWDAWQAFGERMLAACDRVAVLKIDGWRESRGLTAELELARAWEMRVDFLEPDAGSPGNYRWVQE
jgi:sRNA-binding carbon storage regulator CsrA